MRIAISSHVEKLLQELKPEGLMLVVDGCNSSDEAAKIAGECGEVEQKGCSDI